jgi:hypothetical protein
MDPASPGGRGAGSTERLHPGTDRLVTVTVFRIGHRRNVYAH